MDFGFKDQPNRTGKEPRVGPQKASIVVITLALEFGPIPLVHRQGLAGKPGLPVFILAVGFF